MIQVVELPEQGLEVQKAPQPVVPLLELVHLLVLLKCQCNFVYEKGLCGPPGEMVAVQDAVVVVDESASLPPSVM